MKTVLVASVVLTSLAGAAAAGMIMSTPSRSVGTVAERPAPQTVTRQASATPVPAPTIATAVPAQAAAMPPAPPTKSASVEAARPPVPIRIVHKPPVPEKAVAADKKASTDGKASTDVKTGTDTPEKAEAAPDEKSQQAARAAIEADGYKAIQILSQGSNGVWKASALRGKTRVVVSVDQAGNVFTE